MFRTRRGSTAKRGGVDLTLSYTADQAAALAGDQDDLAGWFDTAIVALAALRTGADPIIPERADGRLPGADDVDTKDRPVWLGTQWDERVIHDTTALIARLSGLRAAALRAHDAKGGSHGERAAALAVTRATAQSRLAQLPESDPMELWATGQYAPVTHPGTPVPTSLRDWDYSWPGYTPVDITPPELRPTGPGGTIAGADWAEPFGSPHDLTRGEWISRQHRALIPFSMDSADRPLNPTGRTGRTGRNLPCWGENQAADALVTTGHGASRRVLLIERDDDGGGRGRWAMPGGMVEDGEDGRAASARELHEETGIDRFGSTRDIIHTAHVDDWRETDHAWVATTVTHYPVDHEIPPTAGSDARNAAWWPAPDIETLMATLAPAGGLYAGHIKLLATSLERIDQAERTRAALDTITR